eukprot:gene13394-biopygen5024
MVSPRPCRHRLPSTLQLYPRRGRHRRCGQQGDMRGRAASRALFAANNDYLNLTATQTNQQFGVPSRFSGRVTVPIPFSPGSWVHCDPQLAGITFQPFVPSSRSSSGTPPILSLDDTISAMLLERISAPGTTSRSGIANTLSALRWAGKNLGLPISPKLHVHDTIVRARPAADSALQWLHPHTISQIAEHARNGDTDDLCTCRSVFSFFHALRVSEACRVCPSDFVFRAGQPTEFIIHPSKGQSGPQVPRPVPVLLHPAAEPWAQLFCATAERNPGSPALNPTSAFLNHWLRERLRTTRDAGASWHAHRR